MNYMTYPYVPNLTLHDGKQGVDQDRASVKMRLADALRERKEAKTREDFAFADRKFVESAYHALWALAELEKGRPMQQLTYGTFIRETGIWTPTEGEGADEV